MCYSETILKGKFNGISITIRRGRHALHHAVGVRRMIYIVSGDGARCGSTMMMQALIAGGLEGRYVHKEDYEMGLKEQYSVGFPDADHYDGCVVKALPPPWGAGLKLAARPEGDGYGVIWMHRPDVDRWNSFLKLHKDAYRKVDNMADVHMELQTIIDDTGANVPTKQRVLLNAAYCEGRAADTLAVMKQRRDMSVIEAHYDDVCNDALHIFTTLEYNGWPITPLAAAQVPRRLTKK